MITDALRFPIDVDAGRHAFVVAIATVVVLAIGIRYAMALAPSSLALVPVAGAGVALVVLFGFLSLVLDRTHSPSQSTRSVVRLGVGSLALTVGVLGLPTVLLVLTIGAIAQAGTSLDGGASTVFLAGSAGTLLLFVASAYVLPAALSTAIREGRASGAIDVDVVWAVLSDPTYLYAWTVGFSLLVVAVGLAAVAIGSTDVVGLLSGIAAAYLLLAGTRVIGTGYTRASDSNRGDA